MGETFNAWKDYKREQKERFGVECAECKRLFPKAQAKILLPNETCKRHGWTAPNHPDFDPLEA